MYIIYVIYMCIFYISILYVHYIFICILYNIRLRRAACCTSRGLKSSVELSRCCSKASCSTKALWRPSGSCESKLRKASCAQRALHPVITYHRDLDIHLYIL